MTSFDGERVRARLLTGGFSGAYQRFHAARDAEDSVAALQAIFEALNWAHAIDDLIMRTWSPRGKVEGYDWRSDPALRDDVTDVMRGLRYVRNRVHHDWADAVVPNGGAMIPGSLPLTFSEWIWRKVDQLPAPRSERAESEGRDAYVRALEQRPVEEALTAIEGPFAFIGSLLDPPRPRNWPPVERVLQ